MKMYVQVTLNQELNDTNSRHRICWVPDEHALTGMRLRDQHDEVWTVGSIYRTRTLPREAVQTYYARVRSAEMPDVARA